MSSWKQYGGTNKSEKSNDIKADSIIVNNLSITKPYQGNLIINGGLQITKDLLISGNTQMIGNTVFDNIVVNGLSTFQGIATLNSTFEIEGNIDSKSNVNVENNIICGNVLYFNGQSQFIYADPSGIGINKMNPNAALDISTNLVNGIVIQSSQPISTSTLIQNNDNQGILLYGNTTAQYIDFFNETTLSSETKGDARLSYTKGGIFEIDVSQNINLMSNVTVSNRGSQPHIFNETVIIYDTSNGSFFGNIYSEPITSGSALTLVSSNNNSNTFLHISTPSGEGLAIGGGVYSNDISRSSAFIGLTDSSGQLSNSTIIVSGSDPVKYRSTIGINTFQPQTEKYVVDINGPIHIDNADITIIDQQIPFEIYSMSISKNYRNKIIALGSSYDITIANGFSNYRERIMISNDYGSRWQQIDINNSLLSLKADQLTNIFTYDNSYAFISGTKNTLFFSIDGGYNWNNIITNITINQSFNNIHIGNSTISGNHILYFSSGNILYYYDFSLNNLNLETESIIVNNIVTSLVNINSITTNSNAIFLAGSTIVKYNTSNFLLPPTSHSNTSNISYNEIHSYNNTIIAVGNGIISSSRNNGSSWTDIYQNGIQFNSIFCNDELNCITVGNNGNIWISQDGGISWEFLYDSLLNPSGKKLLVTDPSNILQNVVMSDPNTLILTNTIIPYIQDSQAGSSELINIFIPNFINRANNNILDVCGNMQISGDIRINDGGSLQSTNNTFSILDTSVQNITIGSASRSIILGGTSTGVTELQHNAIIDGNTVLKKNLNVVYDTSLNGNLIVGKNTVINGTSTFISDSSFQSNVVVRNNLTIQGNVIGLYDTSFNGNLTVGNNMVVNGTSNFVSDSLFHSNLQVGNNLTIQGNVIGLYDTSLNENLTVGNNMVVNGTSTFVSDSLFHSNVVVRNNLTIQGNIIGLYDTELNGNLSVSGYSNINSDISIAGNATISKNLSVIEYSNFKSDVSMNGNLIINQNMMVYGNIIGLYDTELNGNLLVKNATINGNLTVLSNLNLTGNLEMSHDSTFFTTHILPNEDGILTIGDNYESTASQIYIGGPHDNIIFQGQVVYELPAINNAPFVVVNANATGYATSGGCGINIYDNSGEPSPYDPLTDAGYIHIGHDLQSFVFKAPNINNLGNQISGNNIVRLGVNSLTLQNPNIINGLVVLQKDQTYHDTQEANGTSFGGYRPNESNYAIVSANLDISNIMLKQIDSITGSQVLETNLIIGNTNINNKLSVYGNVDINGSSNFVSDSSFHSNVVVGNNLTIQGNVIGFYDSSLNGNLTVGKSVVVNGSSTFVSDSSFHSNLQVGKNLTIQEKLIGLYDTSLNGNLTVGKNVVVNGISTFISDSSFNANVVVGKNVTIQGNLVGFFDTSLNGNLTVGKNVIINGTSTFVSDSSFHSNVVVRNNLTIQGNLVGFFDTSFNGNLTLGKNVIVNGTSNFVSDSSFNANVVVGRNLTIQGNLVGFFDTSFNGNLTLGKNVVVNGTSTFISDSSFNSNLQVRNNLTIQGNLVGFFDTSLNGNLTVGKNVVVNGTSTFISDSSFNSNVVVGRNVTIQGNLIGFFDTSLNGNLTLGKNVVVNGSSTFISDSSFNANVVVRNNLTIQGNLVGLYDTSLNGNLAVGKNVVVNGTSNFVFDSSFNANVVVGRNVTIRGNLVGIYDTSLNGNLTLGKNMVINGTSNFISDSSFNSNLQVRNNLTIQGNLVGFFDTSLNGNLTVGKNMVVNGTSTFVSDSSFNANVVVRNNLTIQGNLVGFFDTSFNGNLTVGKNVVVNGTSNFISDSSFNANVVVGKNLTIQGNLVGLYDTSLNGNLTVGKNVVVNGTSTFISDSSFNANVVVGRNVTIRGNINALYDSSLNGNLTVGKNMVINGTSTFISDSSFNGNINIGGNLNIYSTTNSINSTTGALIVNGGAGFGGDVYINGTINARNLGTNNVVYWNSQSLNITSFPTNTYYLLATMGDFSNNYGSININGSIGGQNGTNMATINATIVTSGNVAYPTIIGSINNDTIHDASFCDIVIYYDNSSNNYQPISPSVTTINGFIKDVSNIYYNSSNSIVDVNQFITGVGIPTANSNNAMINTFDNSNNFIINVISDPLSPTPSSRDYSGVILDGNTIVLPSNGNFEGWFLTTDSGNINTYSKPFISDKSGYTYNTPTSNLFNTTTPITVTGFIQDRTTTNHTLITSTANLDGKKLYKNEVVVNVPNVSFNSSSNAGGTIFYIYTLIYILNNPLTTSISAGNSFYGYRGIGGQLITNTNLPSIIKIGNFIADLSNGTVVTDGTKFGTVTGYYSNFIGGINMDNYPSYDISGGIRFINPNYYFTYANTNTTFPQLNHFINTGPRIGDLSAIFLNSISGNNYQLAGSLAASAISTSRFGVSGEKVPYYVVDSSCIAIPLPADNFDIAGSAVGDIVTFGTSSNDGLVTTRAAYNADASNCRLYVDLNTTSLTIDASNGSARNAAVVTTANFTINTIVGTIAVGQFISIPTIPVYNKSSIRVTSYTPGTGAIVLNTAIRIPSISTNIDFYTPDTNLNIIAPSNYKFQTSIPLLSYDPVTYSAYDPVSFLLYEPKTYTLSKIIDISNGIGPPPQYKVYLLTNKGGNNPKGYFNLAITGDVSNNSINLPTDISTNPVAGSNIVIPSLCNTLTTINNTFQTIYNILPTISTASIETPYTNILNSTIPSTFDGSNIVMNTTSVVSSVTIIDSTLSGGSTYKVIIKCSANQLAVTNNVIFSLGYSSSNPLYTSLPLGLDTTTYIAYLTIPTNISGSINLYTHVTAVSTLNSYNIVLIKSIEISRLDTFTNSFVGIGMSNPKYELDVSGNIQANSYNALSDYRLKENIIPISDTNFSIDLLKPVYYNFKGSTKEDLGFLAHEVQTEIPFLVNGDKDGENFQSINYNGFIALLVKEIQDLKSEMKVLKEEVKELRLK